MNHCEWAIGCLVLMLAFVGACGSPTIYHAYRAVPADGWEQTDTLSFGLDTVRSGGDYHVFVGLRTTNAYPYQSLWLLVETSTRNPETFTIDTLVCHLADRHGRQGGHGIDTYQYRYPLTTLSLHKGQTVFFRVRHMMRREMLPGISDIGLEVERITPTDTSR